MALPASSQNKGLSEYRKRASQQRTGPSPAEGREAGGQQPEPERGKLSPRDGILHQTASRLPVANQAFLGSWTDDICRESCSQRLSPQKRHMTHLRSTRVHTENQAAGTGKAIRPKAHLGVTVLAKHLVT